MNAPEATPRELLSVGQFSQKYSAWSPSSLRNLILNAEDRVNSRGEKIQGNGLAPAVIRVGRKVLLDPAQFFTWIADQQRHNRRAA
jgi:hypothetical protein